MPSHQTPVGFVFYVLTSFFVLLFTCQVDAQGLTTGSSQTLFSNANQISDASMLAAPEIVRGRFVNVNVKALASTTSAPANMIRLNLFEDISQVAVQTRVESNQSGSYTWLGSIIDKPQSSVILVVRNGLVTGKVSLDGDIYTIRSPDGSNLHLIAQIDPQQLDPETQLDFLLPPDEAEADTDVKAIERSPNLAASDDGSVIDLLVMYTDDARVQRGGTAGIESIIELGVAESNQAYEQSGATQRIYLVHMEEISHDENTNSTDLGLFRAKNDGELDIVHSLRDTYHADFSKLVVNTSGCGIAYLQTTPGGLANFESSAFSVTDESCISPNYTFVHELGHNMGLRHDWYLDDSTSPYTYAHGYVDRSENWRTIMSYNWICSDTGSSCSRLLYFSNLYATYGGNPMGVAGTTPANCNEDSLSPEPETCVADNASVLDNMRVNNSRFRISEIVWTGAINNLWHEAGNWEIVQGAANRSSGASSNTVNRVPLDIDDVVIPTGLGRYPDLSGTQYVRNVTIQSGASLSMSGGTLEVYGQWEEEGTGTFDGIGGTVNFVGRLPQTITQNASSNFYNLGIGDGTGSIDVSLGSDLDVDGDLTIQAGSVLNGGSRTISVAGNWNELSATAFNPGTGSVIFDGETQVMNKTVSVNLINEPFDDGIDTGYSTVNIPSGWTRQSGWYVGGSDGNGEALASGDAWLHSPAITLIAGIEYNLTVDFNNRGDADTLSVFYGTAANSGDQTNVIGSLNASGSGDFDFSVTSSGTYFIGFFHNDPGNGSSQSFMDNIVLNGTGALKFHNLQVSSTGALVPGQGIAINNDLTTTVGGVLNINAQMLSVEGVVTNNGSLTDTLDVADATLTRFAYIQNASATQTRYQGVEITPTGGSLGETTVRISGNQKCLEFVIGSPVFRCYEIEPELSNAATIRYYYEIAEANGNIENITGAYYLDGSNWLPEGGNITRSSGQDPRWVQATNVSNYSKFALDDAEVAETYTLSVSVSDLVGSGLVLQNNEMDDLAIDADGDFAFSTLLIDNTSYDVTVKTQPSNPAQTCLVGNGEGVVSGSNIDDVTVTCTTNTYSIGGTISGLEGSGLMLQNNGLDDLTVDADGAFTLVTELQDLSEYMVTVAADPVNLSQTCTVSNGTGTLAGSDVIDITVNCVTDSFMLGGDVSGLEGAGLELQFGSDITLPISVDGSFTLVEPLIDGSNYEVFVSTQPNSPNQTCLVANGSGTISGVDVSNIAVTCTTNTYSVGGTVSGLAGSDLVLQNNGVDDLLISADGDFTFATVLDDASDYEVTIKTQPQFPRQKCSIGNGIGELAGADVDDVTVNCVTLPEGVFMHGFEQE